MTNHTSARDLIICSIGVHALEMAEIVERINGVTPTWNLLGFFAEKGRAGEVGQVLDGYSVLGTIDRLGEFPAASLIVGNEFHDPLPLDRCASIMDPSAWVSRTARIGRGCVLYPGCFVGLNAVLGDRVFALGGCTINHDDVLEHDVVLASCATLAGAVHVESGCYLGQSCTIRQHLRIGKGSLVGMGAVVVKDVPPNCVMAGNPARKLRDRK